MSKKEDTPGLENAEDTPAATPPAPTPEPAQDQSQAAEISAKTEALQKQLEELQEYKRKKEEEGLSQEKLIEKQTREAQAKLAALQRRIAYAEAGLPPEMADIQDPVEQAKKLRELVDAGIKNKATGNPIAPASGTPAHTEQEKQKIKEEMAKKPTSKSRWDAAWTKRTGGK